MHSTKLSDRQIAEIYFGLASHYQDCIIRSCTYTYEEIYNKLYEGIYCSLNNPFGPLYALSDEEKSTVYAVFNAFFTATPAFKASPPAYQNQHFQDPSQLPNSPINLTAYNEFNHGRYYLTQFRWTTIEQACYLRYNPYPTSTHYNISTSNHHNHPSRHEENKSNQGDPHAYMLVLMIGAVVLGCALVSVYYLLSQTVNSLERIYYNEGYLQALTTLMVVAVAPVVATMFVEVIAHHSLIALAIAAGLSNPLGWASYAVLGLGFAGGALGTLLFNQVSYYSRKSANEDALDPQEPTRYTLTEAEAMALSQKGIDPIKVKCAIIALRAELGEDPTPSYFNRMFYADSKIQQNLNAVRALRSGKLTTVTIGQMTFDCKSADYGKVQNFQQGKSTSVYQQAYMGENNRPGEASAPFCEDSDIEPPAYTDKPVYNQ